MKNIKILTLDRYLTDYFEYVEGSIYKRVKSEFYRLALSMELEDEEDTQYPIEDLLDRFGIYATDYMEISETDGIRIFSIELEGELDDIRAVSTIVGKRVYNVESDDGIDLVIE